jgi:hypothetical protein
LSFFSSNGFKTNLLIFLAFVTYIIIVVDLNTEYAVEHDEIDQVIAILDKTIDGLDADILQIIDNALPFLGIICHEEKYIYFTETTEFPTGRAPPAYNFNSI